jgi:hypothetical protein
LRNGASEPHFEPPAWHIFNVVPTWTLAIVTIAGVAVGILLGRLTAPTQPSGASAAAPISEAPTTEVAATAAEPAPPQEAPAPEEPAAAEEESTAEVPRIGMEDVVTELERRYQGRRAEEEKDRARRKSDKPPP